MIQVVATDAPATPNGSIDIDHMSFLNLSRDEVATIWFSLETYKKAVLKTARKSRKLNNPNAVEDEAFCFEAASKCAKLQFAILDDYDTNTHARIQAFLDIQ